jgi:dolichol kinase
MVGRAVGRHRWRRDGPKTVEGSAAFVTAAFLACCAARACATPGHAASLPPWSAAVPAFILTGALGAAVELASPTLWDNLAVFLATLPLTLWLL